jgi:hypothetical protein
MLYVVLLADVVTYKSIITLDSVYLLLVGTKSSDGEHSTRSTSGNFLEASAFILLPKVNKD